MHITCIFRIFCIVLNSLLLFYRRLFHDDSRGVGEVLNETACILDKCEGLTVSIPR